MSVAVCCGVLQRVACVAVRVAMRITSPSVMTLSQHVENIPSIAIGLMLTYQKECVYVCVYVSCWYIKKSPGPYWNKSCTRRTWLTHRTWLNHVLTHKTWLTHISKRVLARISINHAHMWFSHGTYMNTTWHIYERVMAHVNWVKILGDYVYQYTYNVCFLAWDVCCSVLQCVAVCCSVLQCVAVCCSVLQCVAVRCNDVLGDYVYQYTHHLSCTPL